MMKVIDKEQTGCEVHSSLRLTVTPLEQVYKLHVDHRTKDKEHPLYKMLSLYKTLKKDLCQFQTESDICIMTAHHEAPNTDS